MKIGYCRVSTDEQNPDLQLTALKAAGCDRLFTDKTSGATAKRPQLVRCLKVLTEGGQARCVEAGQAGEVTWGFDRAAR